MAVLVPSANVSIRTVSAAYCRLQIPYHLIVKNTVATGMYASIQKGVGLYEQFRSTLPVTTDRAHAESLI